MTGLPRAAINRPISTLWRREHTPNWPVSARLSSGMAERRDKFITSHLVVGGVGSRVKETNVIDNKKVSLLGQLMEILPRTKSANIAVGYFFVSGLAAIMEPLQKVDKVRLLISNTTDKETSEALIEGFKSVKQVCSDIERKKFVNNDRRQKIIEDSEANMTRSLEYMSQTLDDKNVVQTLISMMREKRIEVKVYPKGKLHAKAYILELHGTEVATGVGIVGSSNLSLAGMSENSELNLKTLNGPDVNKLLEWFDARWEEGVEFTQKFSLILERSWAGHVYTPYEIFLKAIYHEYRDRVDPEHELDPVWEAEGPLLFPFQRQAVDRCITMIELYGGAIIGDVVGLGKTYVGTTLLKHFQMQEYRPLIVCPPALVNMWEEFCAEYEVDAKILSRGMLTQKTYDLAQDYKYKDRDLVLVDESHHFKNHRSHQYENLQRFMHARDARAILLTATPYSNDADEIKNQIMLFHTSPKTSIPPANDTDLDKFFKLVKDDNKALVALLQNIMIRRTRRYVLGQWGHRDENNPNRRYLLIGDQRKYFPSRNMETHRYDINRSYCKKYDAIVRLLDKSCLALARYSPGLYLKHPYQKIEPYSDLKTTGPKLVRLVRSSLLKRMESSVEAFRVSIGRYINTHRIFLKALESKIMPVGDLASAELYEAADPESDIEDDPVELQKIVDRIKQKGESRYKFAAFEIERLEDDVRRDLATFENIMVMLGSLEPDTDDKLYRLQKLLNSNKNKKVIVFTEFAATAKYLHANLEWDSNENMELVTSKHNNVLQAARRFDPKNNPAPRNQPVHEKELTLLITTDVLSEGVNLQAGHVVINYDFHWNPVRLIQRVGRVDRIGSQNEHITVYNFLPDPEIEKDLRLEESVSLKIGEIQRIIGEDYPILVQTEKINEKDMYAIYKQDSSVLDYEASNPLEPTEFEEMLINIHENNPELWNEFRKIPDGARSAKHPRGGGGELLLACSTTFGKNDTITKYYVVGHGNKVRTIDSRTALSLLKSTDSSTPTLPADYDSKLSAGWEKFLAYTEQREAGARTRIKLTTSQKYIRKRLIEISRSSKHFKNKEMVDPLSTAFSIPILKGKLNRELNRIRKAKLDDSQLIDALSEIYRNFDLQKKTEQREKEAAAPRIVYSEYIGEHNE